MQAVLRLPAPCICRRNSPYRPCHYVALDRANQCVVLSIRCGAGLVGTAAVRSAPGCPTVWLPITLLSTLTVQAHLVVLSLLLSCMPSCTVPSACRGSLQIGDLLSDLAAAPMEVTIGGTDGWVHQVRCLGHVPSTWSAAGAVVWHYVLSSLQQALHMYHCALSLA